MWLRRRFCNRIFLFCVVVGGTFYFSVIIFGDLKLPRVLRLTDLSTCPACYGVSICPELYSGQIAVDQYSWYQIVFNAKNIYYGYTKNQKRKVVLKKLAHDSEHKHFDNTLCKTWGLPQNCKPVDLQACNVTNVEEKIIKLVQYNFTHPEKKPRKGLIFCPYPQSIYDFIKPAIHSMTKSKSYVVEMINIWTMLSLNPEPIILQNIPKSKGWPTPGFAGVCGRLELVAYEGEPLSSMLDIEWERKMEIAQRIIDAAMDFTYKHERYRFYLMDWSLDNIVVNEKNNIFFIDLEDVIVLDKYIAPNSDLKNWYQGFRWKTEETDYSFQIDNLCKHHLSDHNLYSACYILVSGETPFLHPGLDANHKLIHDNILKHCLPWYR